VGGAFDTGGEIGAIDNVIQTSDGPVNHFRVDWVKTFRLNWVSYSCYVIALTAVVVAGMCAVAGLIRTLLSRLSKTHAS
jgi:hypothetical protein